MKHIVIISLSLLLAARVGIATAQTKKDSTSVSRSAQGDACITWRFGSLKASVKKAEHSIDNDDVVGGISKGS